jgi:hypothetical protein
MDKITETDNTAEKRAIGRAAALPSMLSKSAPQIFPALNQFKRKVVGVAPMAPIARALRGRLTAADWGAASIGDRIGCATDGPPEPGPKRKRPRLEPRALMCRGQRVCVCSACPYVSAIGATNFAVCPNSRHESDAPWDRRLRFRRMSSCGAWCRDC